LQVENTNISDISFLEKNKNIKELNLNYCKNIKDFKPIIKLHNLEVLDAQICQNKNIKELILNYYK